MTNQRTEKDAARHPLGRVHAIAVRSQGSSKFSPKKVNDHLVLPEEAPDSNLTQMPLFCVAPDSLPSTARTEWLKYVRRHLPIADPFPVDEFYEWLQQTSHYLPASPAIVHVPLGEGAGYLDVATMQVHLPSGEVVDTGQAGCDQMAETARFMLLQSLNKVYQKEGHVCEDADADEDDTDDDDREPIRLPPAGKVLSADVAYDDIKRLVRKGAQLGMLTPVLCYNEEDDLYVRAIEYAPSLLDQKLESNARLSLETGETLPKWQALRRTPSRGRQSLLATGSPYEPTVKLIIQRVARQPLKQLLPVVLIYVCIRSKPSKQVTVAPVVSTPPLPFHNQRYVGVLDRRSQMQACQVADMLSAKTSFDACQGSTSAMQQPSVTLKCHAHTLYARSVMSVYKRDAYYTNAIEVDGILALFNMSSYPKDNIATKGRLSAEQKSHPLAAALQNTIEHCNNRKVPMMVALDVSNDDCNPQGFQRLAEHCEVQWSEQRDDVTTDTRSSSRSLCVLQVQLPISKGSQFKGVVDLVDMKAYMLTDGGLQTFDIPPDMQDKAQKLHNEMLTSLAPCSRKLRTAVRMGEKLSLQELRHAIRTATLRQTLAPLVYFHGGKGEAGMLLLRQPIVDYLPSPWDLQAVQEYYPSGYERVEGQ